MIRKQVGPGSPITRLSNFLISNLDLTSDRSDREDHSVFGKKSEKENGKHFHYTIRNNVFHLPIPSLSRFDDNNPGLQGVAKDRNGFNSLEKFLPRQERSLLRIYWQYTENTKTSENEAN